MKIGRRLQGLGAVAVKNSVYVLPRSDQALEDFQWVRREIVAGGGDASVCEARFVEGLSDDAVEALFNAAREADYEALAREARRAAGERWPAAASGREPGEQVDGRRCARLRKRLARSSAIDFFGAPGRDAVEGAAGRGRSPRCGRRDRGAEARAARRPATSAAAPGSPAAASTSTASPAPG